MKRKIAVVLSLALLLTSTVFSLPAFGADAVTSASAPAATTPAPAAPAAPAKAATTTSTVADASGVYVVVSGDMLWKIAQKYNLTLDALKALNPQIKNYNLIVPGQKINVKAAVPAAPAATVAKKLYQGLGVTTAFRNGPGKDEEGNPVYSLNVAIASVVFDADGKIVDAYIDGLEVATPNYDGESMPHFDGWPGLEGYFVYDHATKKITGKSTPTVDSATAQVAAWQTKRERGDAYHMNPANEWYKQMNFYQNYFKGKTVAELEAWFAKNTTTAGRPIKANTTNAADLEKYNKLTAAEKAALADVVAGATMSLRDPHGDFLGAVAEAYKNRVEMK